MLSTLYRKYRLFLLYNTDLFPMINNSLKYLVYMPWLFIHKFGFIHIHTFIYLTFVKHNKYIFDNDNQTNAILVKKKKWSTIKAPGNKQKAIIARNFSLPWARHRDRILNAFGCLKEKEGSKGAGQVTCFCFVSLPGIRLESQVSHRIHKEKPSGSSDSLALVMAAEDNRSLGKERERDRDNVTPWLFCRPWPLPR